MVIQSFPEELENLSDSTEHTFRTQQTGTKDYVWCWMCEWTICTLLVTQNIASSLSGHLLLCLAIYLSKQTNKKLLFSPGLVEKVIKKILFALRINASIHLSPALIHNRMSHNLKASRDFLEDESHG